MQHPTSTTRAFNVAFLLISLDLISIDCSAEKLTTKSVEVIATRENLIGIADTASEGVVTNQKIMHTSISRPGEILEQTPGLIVSQHSGDGKANQYYLRGFNLDHGTDFALWLDGMPLNMPTHAHGQGYIDANLLIPELIESMEYKKGPYHAELGDFSAAGAAKLNYYRQLPKSFASLTYGRDQYLRFLNAGSQQAGAGNLLYAIETQSYDGPWSTPENLRKLNGVVRFSSGNTTEGFDLTAMAYQSQWDATDQIPKRALSAGLIDRYGAVDGSNGGDTSRYSLSADWRNGSWQANAYMIHYKLNLFSNFTYFLDDPVNGDQFEQADKRNIYGGQLKREWDTELLGLRNTQALGLQTRYDDIDNVGLYRTKGKQRLATTRQDAVKQSSVGLWWQGNWVLMPSLRATTGLRSDWYSFDINSDIAANSGNAVSDILSPKLGLAWRALKDTEIYLNWGSGFHSNDGRGSTITINPVDGSPANRVNPLVKAVGKELGLRTNWLSGWQSTLTAFQLDIDSELLFIGDAGSTEASRPSRRRGVEWSNHLRIKEDQYLDADFSFTQARFRDADSAGSDIPGAIAKTASLGLLTHHGAGWSTSLRLRYFGPRALTEDNSVSSEGSFLTNGRLAYQYTPKISFALDVFNLFNRKVADIDYYYVSRLAGEPASGVNDTHTHPAEPRMLRLTMRMDY